MSWEPPTNDQPDVPVKPVFEYTIELDYRMIVEEPGCRTLKVLADNTEDAIEKAWEEVYELEGVEDIEEDTAEIIATRDVSIPGSRDDKTLNLFPDLKIIPRGTKRSANAQS